MSSDARLLIIEMVLPEGDTPHRGKIIDMAMLEAIGGKRAPKRSMPPSSKLSMPDTVVENRVVSIVEAGLA